MEVYNQELELGKTETELLSAAHGTVHVPSTWTWAWTLLHHFPNSGFCSGERRLSLTLLDYTRVYLDPNGVEHGVGQ
jgi:hypothetical protein